MRLLIVLCLCCLPFISAQADPRAVQRLGELLRPVQTLSGSFSQMTLDGSGSSLQETTGKMSLRRPGLFRWHTDAPQEQLLVSDGKQVWLYDPDLQQVTLRALDQRLTHTPALLLSGDIGEISKNFDVSYKESSGVVDFELHPKARDTLFDSLRMSFRSGMINDMQLIDSAGQRTNILFSGVQLNPKLDDSLFHFQVPKGADLIRE